MDANNQLASFELDDEQLSMTFGGHSVEPQAACCSLDLAALTLASVEM